MVPSRRYGSQWRVLLAAVGCLIACSALGQPSAPQRPIDDAERSEPDTQVAQPEPAERQTEATLLAIQDAINTAIREVAEAIRAQAETPEDAQRAEDDLLAQQGMALWAIVMGVATVLQFFASVVGIVLVAKTLRATRESVDVIADTSQQQLRVYVSVVRAEINLLNAGNVPRCKIVVKNGGQTPAYKVLAWSMFVFGSNEEATRFLDPPKTVKLDSFHIIPMVNLALVRSTA